MSLLRQYADEIRLAAYAEAVAAAGLALATALLLRHRLTPANIALLLMLAVVFVGLRRGLLPALLTAALGALSWSFMHTAPRVSFRADRVEDLILWTSLAMAALLTGRLAARLQQQFATSSALAELNGRLYEITRYVAGAEREEELVASLRSSIGSALRSECVILIADERGVLESVDPSEPTLDAAAHADAGWCFTRIADDPLLGQHRAPWDFLRLNSEHGPLGVLGVRRPDIRKPLDRGQRGLLLALRDLCAAAIDRRRLTDRIRRAQMSAETDKLRAALLSSVSHDLRTPLSGIIGAASTLVGPGISLAEDARADLLATVLDEAERLDRFVGNLIDMTRLEAGGPQPRPSWCDLRDVVADVLRGLSRVLAERKLELRIEPGFPLLYVDGFLLDRVIANLVDNAVKYSAAGTPVMITAQRKRDTAILCVIDRGRGIPPEEREAVFDPFHRLRDADHRVAGTGLGLAICRGLTESLGGKIEVKSGPDDIGTCVEVRLPITRKGAGAAAS